MQVRTSAPLGSDHATRTWLHPCASRVLPSGTPGSGGGGSGMTGTGLAALVRAGLGSTGDHGVGLDPTSRCRRAQTWTPHRLVLPKSRDGTSASTAYRR